MKKLICFYGGLLIVVSASFGGSNRVPSLVSLACSRLLESVEISEVDQLIKEGRLPLHLFNEIKLNGEDLSGSVVQGGQFTRCKFRNIKFRQSNFNHTLFKEVIFEDCDFSDAILTDAIFEDCHFLNANLERADIRNIYLRNSIFKGTIIDRLRLLDNLIVKNSDSSPLYLYEVLELYSNCIDIKNKNMDLGKSREVALYDRVLNQMILPSIDLRLKRVPVNDRAPLWTFNLSGINLQGAHLFCRFLPGINLSGANLRNAKLQFVDLSAANLKGANLQGADLSYTQLGNADLTDANLENCHLRGTSLVGTKLENSNFENTKLTKIDLRSTDLTTVNFQNASFEKGGLNLRGARCPGSWDVDELQASGKNERAIVLLTEMHDVNLY